LNGTFNFNLDTEKIRWLKTSYSLHALAMLDRWMEEDAKVIGRGKAIEKRKFLINEAKG
jgi:hypothetical protein